MSIASNIMGFADWIAATRASDALRDQFWIVPTSQSIHIVAVSVLFVAALIIGLELLGIGRFERSRSVIIQQQTRWIFASLIVLLLTGTLQTVAEPARQFGSPAFWIKMGVIAFSVLLTCLLVRGARRDPQRRDAVASYPWRSRIHALVIVGAWIAIIFCGRFIGYT